MLALALSCVADGMMTQSFSSVGALSLSDRRALDRNEEVDSAPYRVHYTIQSWHTDTKSTFYARTRAIRHLESKYNQSVGCTTI